MNLDIPEHVKVKNFLDDLDGKLFKSKNQFIVEAACNYIDQINNGTAFQEKDTLEALENRILKRTQEYVDKRFEGALIMALNNNLTGNINIQKASNQSYNADDDFEYDDELAKVTSMFTD